MGVILISPTSFLISADADDHPHLTAAAFTAAEVELENPLQPLRPAHRPVALGGDFPEAVLTFQAIATGAMNLVVNDDGGFVSGWFDYDTTEYVPVSYTRADIPITPIPAAVWLFGSALGVMGWMRRQAAINVYKQTPLGDALRSYVNRGDITQTGD